MSKLPKDLGVLCGVMAFCAAMLIALLRSSPPLVALKKAGLCGIVLAGVAWIGAHIALSVIRAGLRQYERERTG
ncbi:MAG: hypothetical protein PVJ27_09310 [Candidatus Brocadiaceae bacterium]|jgi:hypothetical protein